MAPTDNGVMLSAGYVVLIVFIVVLVIFVVASLLYVLYFKPKKRASLESMLLIVYFNDKRVLTIFRYMQNILIVSDNIP